MKKPTSPSRRRFVQNSTLAVTAAAMAQPLKTLAQATPEMDQEITRAVIYPGIGMARVGNSRLQGLDEGYYIGPEVVETPIELKAQREETIRDENGALKRQAARFRIYGLNKSGQVVRELTADNAEIEWSVQLANKKASWYCFDFALDIELEDSSVEAEARRAQLPKRNPQVTGEEREDLMVRPRSRTVSGRSIGLNQSLSENQFDDGVFRYVYDDEASEPRQKYREVSVNLGEIKTDEQGRLLVLGGKGQAASPPTKNNPHGFAPYDPQRPISFNNATGWYDDIADGPVTASVTFQGEVLPVESSWVAVGPPNYAPDVVGWRTLYDMLVDVYLENEMFDRATLRRLQTTSFTRDVLPMLRRLTGLQWVNAGFLGAYGVGAGENYFDDPRVIQELGRKLPLGLSNASFSDARQQRQALLESLRLPGSEPGFSGSLWPALYGDAFGSFARDLPENDYIISNHRTEHLQRWIRGDYQADWRPAEELQQLSSADRGRITGQYETIDQVPLAEQPSMLDQASLHYCLADAFHPGCELTWPMRNASMYRAPFRIRHQEETQQDYGENINHEIVMRADGPLAAQSAGDLTRWMAIPWQGDTVFCRSGYEPEIDPYLPSYWPARVPNHVLSEVEYSIVMNASLPIETRKRAFMHRRFWTRFMRGSAPGQILQMVAQYADMGVIEARPGIPGDDFFPPVMLVESIPASRKRQETPLPRTTSQGPLGSESSTTQSSPTTRSGPDGSEATPAQRGGWESQEQLDEFRSILQRNQRRRRQ